MAFLLHAGRVGTDGGLDGALLCPVVFVTTSKNKIMIINTIFNNIMFDFLLPETTIVKFDVIQFGRPLLASVATKIEKRGGAIV